MVVNDHWQCGITRMKYTALLLLLNISLGHCCSGNRYNASCDLWEKNQGFGNMIHAFGAQPPIQELKKFSFCCYENTQVTSPISQNQTHIPSLA